jgi:predicted regulator of Ras-like GTPase activity (Roadblock/LC7/MglB family)
VCATERDTAREPRLDESLEALTKAQGVLGAVLATEDGFLLAARVSGGQDKDGLAAAAATMGRVADETLGRLGRGALEVATLEASKVTFLVRRVSVGFLLVAAEPTADVGVITTEMGRAAALLERAAAALVGR